MNQNYIKLKQNTEKLFVFECANINNKVTVALSKYNNFTRLLKMKKKRPTPWKTLDVGDDKTAVIDANGKIVIYEDSELSLEEWDYIVNCVNEYERCKKGEEEVKEVLLGIYTRIIRLADAVIIGNHQVTMYHITATIKQLSDYTKELRTKLKETPCTH
jgi:hypothetical protein